MLDAYVSDRTKVDSAEKVILSNLEASFNNRD